MRIFLCWSGERSRHVVESFDIFLKELNQKLFPARKRVFDPFRSANIEKGLPWFQAVERELAGADAALVAITPENCTSPWMHYEAGAVANRMGLAKRGGKDKDNRNEASSAEELQGRLFTYLFGLNAAALQGPLAAYQSTEATYDDTRALVRRLLQIAQIKRPTDDQIKWPTDEKSAESTRWEKNFRLCWNNFVVRLRPCRHQRFSDLIPDFAPRFHGLTFTEPVALCHRQAWTDRITGCRQVLTDLRCRLDQVKERCRPFEADLFSKLLTALDGYEMTMHAYLVEDKHFGLGNNGKLTMCGNVEWVCENRRHIVQRAVCDLRDPQTAPVFDESAGFADLEIFAEKKAMLHRKAAAIRHLFDQKPQGDIEALSLEDIEIADVDSVPALPAKVEFERAVRSSWDFDRAIFFLAHSESLRRDLPQKMAEQYGICTTQRLKKDLLGWIKDELERIKAGPPAGADIQPKTSLSPSAESVETPASSTSEERGAPKPSRVPLSYALEILLELQNRGDSISEDYRSLLQEIEDLERNDSESRVRARAKQILNQMTVLQNASTARAGT